MNLNIQIITGKLIRIVSNTTLKLKLWTISLKSLCQVLQQSLSWFTTSNLRKRSDVNTKSARFEICMSRTTTILKLVYHVKPKKRSDVNTKSARSEIWMSSTTTILKLVYHVKPKEKVWCQYKVRSVWNLYVKYYNNP